MQASSTLLNASVKNNRTFFTKNTLSWVYTKTPTWELTGTVNTLMWELIGKDNGLTWVYTIHHVGTYRYCSVGLH